MQPVRPAGQDQYRDRVLLAAHPRAATWDVMWSQVVECLNRDAAQIQNRCNPYCPDLFRLFFRPEAG